MIGTGRGGFDWKAFILFQKYLETLPTWHEQRRVGGYKRQIKATKKYADKRQKGRKHG